MSRQLEELVREARDHLGTRPLARLDWDAVGRWIMARVERESRAAVRKPRGVRPIEWEAFAATIAFALIVVVLLGKAAPRTNVERGALAASKACVGVVTDVEGEVLVGGAPAAEGTRLHAGDVIDAQAGALIASRPGKVAFVAERGSRVRLVPGGETTVLALEDGAVEANVVPVATGEAFAVDVGVSRVAAHGTHLRVARDGDHVTVDLNDGIISLGRAPRSGEVAGLVVAAPAHAEFVVAASPDTVVVTHAAAAVRSPVSVIPGALRGSMAVPVTPTLAEPDSVDPSSPPAYSVSARPGPTRPPARAVPPRSAPPTESFATPAALAIAIRNCLKEEPHADNVTVAFESTLYLQMGEDGSVRSARFEPPVAPDVNACAAPLIYSARFGGGGAVAVPIDFKE